RIAAASPRASIGPWSAPARFAASLCDPHARRLVSRGPHRRSAPPVAGDVSRSRPCARHVLVSGGCPRALAARDPTTCRGAEGGRAMNASASFAGLLQRFFTDRLVQQRRASPHTVASYRDTFRLLLRFAQHRIG